MADSDPTMAPTMAALRAELSKGTSEYSIAGISDSFMVGVFNVYADSAATRTIDADWSAWKKWKVFLALNRIRKDEGVPAKIHSLSGALGSARFHWAIKKSQITEKWAFRGIHGDGTTAARGPRQSRPCGRWST